MNTYAFPLLEIYTFICKQMYVYTETYIGPNIGIHAYKYVCITTHTLVHIDIQRLTEKFEASSSKSRNC